MEPKQENSPSAGAKPRGCMVDGCDRAQAVEEQGWQDGAQLCDTHMGTPEGERALREA